jgi:hypothetical protein
MTALLKSNVVYSIGLKFMNLLLPWRQLMCYLIFPPIKCFTLG